MKKDRLEFLKKHIHELEIDVENGIILNRNLTIKLDGYTNLKLGYKYYYVHEVIAVAGGLDILNKTVDHVNMKKYDNRISNLEAVTRKENTRRANTGVARNQKQKPYLYNEETRNKMKADYATGKYTYVTLSEKYGISRMHLNRILNHY